MPYYFGGCRKSQWRQIKHRTVTEEPLVDVVQFIMISISTFRVWPGGAGARAPSSSQSTTRVVMALSATGRARLRLSGGRNAASGITVTVFGCTGFLGRYVCAELGGYSMLGWSFASS